mgnify:FL=1
MMFGQNPYMPQYPQPYYAPPMQDNLAQLRAQQTPAQQSPGVIWVQGEEGAKAYMVAAGNSVMLMDSESSTFYLKSTDRSGMPLPLRVFDYTERTAPAAPQTAQAAPGAEYVSRAEFNALAARVGALMAKEAGADA